MKRSANRKRVELMKLRRTLFRAIQSVDRRWNPASHSFSCAMVLAACHIAGDHVDVVSEITGFSRDFCGRVIARLRKDRVLYAGKIRINWHDAHGDVGFICDALVAAGLVRRGADPKVVAAGKERRDARASKGLCVTCGGQRETGRTCAKCREAVKASAKRRADRLTSPGVITPNVVQTEAWYRATPEMQQMSEAELKRA
jgi:hypothetical protein